MNRSQTDSKPTEKANLKFVKGGQPQQSRLRAGGVLPNASMQSGIYKAVCEAARVASKWGKQIVECSFRVVEGEHFGTYLPGWFSIHVVNGIVAPCKYITQCEAVLGREIEPGDDIDPEVIFVGKLLSVEVKFRSTNGKTRSAEDPTIKKGETDFLRVSSVLGQVEL